MKHQANCYRNINGKQLLNYCDLIYSEEENNSVITEAKATYKVVRKIKHPAGHYQLFVSDKDLKK